jgi:hypothetical protein
MPLRLLNGSREGATFLTSSPPLVLPAVERLEKQALPEPKATKVTPEQLDLLVQLVPLAQRVPLVLTVLLAPPAPLVPLVPLVLPGPPVLPVKMEVER